MNGKVLPSDSLPKFTSLYLSSVIMPPLSSLSNHLISRESNTSASNSSLLGLLLIVPKVLTQLTTQTFVGIDQVLGSVNKG